MVRGGDNAEAERSYHAAIAAARAHGARKREAFALWLAAAHQRERDPAQADRLHQEATAAFRRWGANLTADTIRA